MKTKVLGVALAVIAAAPAIVAPKLVANVQAQATATAEYPDVPRNHWAYEAINRLSQAGIIEGRPGGKYVGAQAMTRYEFAVAIARLLDKMGGSATGGVVGPVGPAGPQGIQGPAGGADMTRAEINDLIAALRREFATDLANLGVRVDAFEGRIAALENRVPTPPRLTITPSILHRTGAANYIGNGGGGRTIVNGGGVGTIPNNGVFDNDEFVNGKFSYTDLELRMTDRVTDRLSVNAALRSLSGTQEDPWAGEGTGNAYVREAFAVANLSDRTFLGVNSLNVILGRQRTKIAQGLLYDNDLVPTDQIHSQFNIGPVALTGLFGSTNNNTALGANPYLTQGAVPFLGGGAGGGFGGASTIGFPGALGVGGGFADDNETLLRAGFNLFRIAGNPVQVGITRQFDGVQAQRGDSFDLSLPLFNRTVGFEYVRQRQYANGSTDFNGGGAGNGKKPSAYNVTVPVLRARSLDLNFAYGKARDNFEYMLSSSANPFARTYAEAIFDRPLALGAPLISAGAGGVATGYAAAKKVVDFNGTLRVLRRLPLDFRYYNAEGAGGIDLGRVYSVGSTFNVTPGLDVEVKYGEYNPDVAGLAKIKYVRFGANVGF